MFSQGVRRALQGAALLVLVSIGSALVEDAFFHTDDGCLVETHCIACRWHYGAVVVAPHVVAVLPTPARPFQRPVQPEDRSPMDGAPRSRPSRGPPLA